MSVGETIYHGDLIQFNLLDLDIILGMKWLHAYGAKSDCKDLEFILCGEKSQ